MDYPCRRVGAPVGRKNDERSWPSVRHVLTGIGPPEFDFEGRGESAKMNPRRTRVYQGETSFLDGHLEDGISVTAVEWVRTGRQSRGRSNNSSWQSKTTLVTLSSGNNYWKDELNYFPTPPTSVRVTITTYFIAFEPAVLSEIINITDPPSETDTRAIFRRFKYVNDFYRVIETMTILQIIQQTMIEKIAYIQEDVRSIGQWRTSRQQS